MADVRRRRTAAGETRWDVRYRDDTRRQRKRTFDRKADAIRFTRRVETDLLRGEWIDPRKSREPFEVWAATWRETRGSLKPKTRESYESILQRHLLPAFGTVPIGAIDYPRVLDPHRCVGARGSELDRHAVGGEQAAAALTGDGEAGPQLRAVPGQADHAGQIVGGPARLAAGGVTGEVERFTDMVGSTELMTALGDDASDALRREHFERLGTIVVRHSGEVVKTLGDGIVAAFGSAAAAMDAAADMQAVVARENRRRGTVVVGLRVGCRAATPPSRTATGSGSRQGVPCQAIPWPARPTLRRTGWRLHAPGVILSEDASAWIHPIRAGRSRREC